MNRKIIYMYLMIAVFGIILGYIIFEDIMGGEGRDAINPNENLENNTEKNVKDISSTVVVSSENLNSNTNLNFEVGDRFIYKQLTDKTGGADSWIEYDFSIEGIEIIDGEKCYRILHNLGYYRYIGKTEATADNTDYGENVILFSGIGNDPQHEGLLKQTITSEIYVNKEEGSVTMMKFKDNEEDVVLKGDAASAIINGMSTSGSFFYAPWMLALNRDFKWEQKIDIDYADEGTQNSIIRYEVVDMGEVHGRKCFKVEANEVSEFKTVKKLEEKSILWIDVEKRILVKKENWFGNLKTDEIDLVSGL